MHFSSAPQTNNNQTIIVDSTYETTPASPTPIAYKGKDFSSSLSFRYLNSKITLGISSSDTVNDPLLSPLNTLSCRAGTILSFNEGQAASDGFIVAMDIKPYSGGPSAQTLLSLRDSSTNVVSFVAEISDSTGYITFYRKD